MVIIIVVLVLCLIFFTYNIYHNKITFLNIKLNNIEEKINSTLIKRKELIKESEDLIKEIINTDKQVYDGLSVLSETNLSMMELDRKLLIYINEFHLINDKYKKLQNNDNFQKIVFAINDTEDTLSAYKEYYNDNTQKYNKVIKSFPINIISFFKRRKEKSFFDNKSVNDSDYGSFKY